MQPILERRAQRAAESLMDNESLTEGLDTEAANILLSWGIEHARNIAWDTSEVLDEEQAQTIMYLRLRALRRMMSLVTTLICCQASLDAAGRANSLEQIIAQAGTVYGPDFNAPDETRLASLLQAPLNPPEAWIASLRAMLDNKTANP
jgi:hypothetical protein